MEGILSSGKTKEGLRLREVVNHYIEFEVSCKQVGRWWYTRFYDCPERSRRQESWHMLRDLAVRTTIPWCVVGNFNDLMFNHEKEGGRVHPRFLLEGFIEVVNDCGLIDLGFVGSVFMWEISRRSSTWVQERLDRLLASHDWKNMFPLAKIKVVDVSTLDHLPLFYS